MKLTKEQFKETKIQLPDEETARQFLNELAAIGISFYNGIKDHHITSRTYFIDEQCNLSYSSSQDLMGFQEDFKILTWDEINEIDVSDLLSALDKLEDKFK